jgi:hypothetical protein
MPLALPKAFKKAHVQRMRYQETLGLSRPRLSSLVDQGILEKDSQGLYIPRAISLGKNQTYKSSYPYRIFSKYENYRKRPVLFSE